MSTDDDASTPAHALISIATQCTADYVHEIVPMVSRWRSRVSVAVLAIQSVALTHHAIARLRACSVDVMRFVDFHIVLADGPDVYTDFKAGASSSKSYMKLVEESSLISSVSCEDMLSKGVGSVMVVTDRYANKGVDVPTNALRNVARQYIRTPHVLVLDCDLVPSNGLAYEYERVVSEYGNSVEGKERDMTKVAFVIPGVWCVLIVSYYE